MTVRLVSDRSGVAPQTKKRTNPGHLSLVPPRLPAREANWALEPHVCRCCFGRIVSRVVAQTEEQEYLCTNCGARAEGHTAAVVCSCGMKIRKRNASGRSGGPMIDAGVRCMINPNPLPEFPSLFVAGEESPDLIAGNMSA